MSDLVGNPEDRFSRVEAHLMFASNLGKVDAAELAPKAYKQP